VQLAAGDHVAFEVPEHTHVCSFLRPVGEEVGIAGEESLGEEKDGDGEGEAGADGAEVVVPSPSCGLSKETTNYEDVSCTLSYLAVLGCIEVDDKGAYASGRHRFQRPGTGCTYSGQQRGLRS